MSFAKLPADESFQGSLISKEILPLLASLASSESQYEHRGLTFNRTCHTPLNL